DGALTAALGPAFEVERFADPASALDRLESSIPDVLLCGANLAGASAADFVEQAVTRVPATTSWTAIVLAASGDQSAFQTLVDRDRLFYLSNEPPSVLAIGELVRAAARFVASANPVTSTDRDPTSDRDPLSGRDLDAVRRIREALSAARELAAHPDPRSATRAASRALHRLVSAERATYLEVTAHQTLIAHDEIGRHEPEAERTESAAAGLAAFVARTGQPTVVPRAADDPRYDGAADDPEGDGSEGLMLAPVEMAGGARGVLVLARDGNSPFDATDEEVLALIASQLAGVLDRLSRRRQLDTAVHRRATGGRDTLYREEALRAHTAQAVHGEALDLSPTWIDQSYRVLALAALAALAFLIFGTIREDASGPAVVRVDGLDTVVAPVAGTVTEVLVEPGDSVTTGDVVLRLYDAEEAIDLDRWQRDFDRQLVRRLRQPDDVTVQRELSGLRGELERARARLEARWIRARTTGVVGDVLRRRGQSVAPGDIVATIATEGSSRSLVALLPGEYRPQIEVGATIRFEVAGYRYAYQTLEVERLGKKVVSGAAAEQLLGPEVAGSLTLPPGPVFVVHARLPDATFSTWSDDYDFYDGMVGTARVRVREAPILLQLVPGLEAVLEAGHP
ncbi:MAG: GAF domain-containing protein, partial [Acidobacteriota bacterium]